MATCLFRSPLSFRLHAFREARIAAGRSDTSTLKILIYLDRFLMGKLKPGGTITKEIAERFYKSTQHLSPGTRINRLSILRQFCRYLSHFDRRTCIVHRSYIPLRTRPAPHIYSRSEVRQIIEAAKNIGPAGSLRPAVIATLIGLLYTTGLRIGEALKLTIGDVDLKKRLLTVRESKFKKSRYVPLSPSCVESLRIYLKQRQKAGFSTSKDSPVFVTPNNKAYGHPNVVTIFLRIVRALKIRGPQGQRGPRIHDFRHTFAVSRLLEWYREGSNLYSKLPLLSTYLGHSTVTCTELYLHATAELLEKVGKRFHSHFAVPPISLGKNHD